MIIFFGFAFCRYQISEDQWKRKRNSEPEKSADERQIIRVAQQKQPSSQSQQSHQSKSQSSYHSEPVSPPEPATNHYQQRRSLYEPSSHATTTPTSKSHLSPLDYVKNRIVEVMRNDDDKSSLGDRNGGSGGNDKDDKADNSPSGEMVIDESPNQGQPTPQAQTPTPATFQYPFNALSVHAGPPPAPPPSGGGTSITVVKSEEPAPLLSAQYEPLSDED